MSKRFRTRFEAVRESELDMRCLARDMQKRRQAQDRIEKLARDRQRGKSINEIEMVRLKATNKRLSSEILVRWDRLHRRMNRERARREQIEHLFGYKGEGDGKSASA